MNYLVEKRCGFMKSIIGEGYERNMTQSLSSDSNPEDRPRIYIFSYLIFLK
jgi:hypothetical protein